MFALSRKWLQRRDGSSRTELESQSIQSISNSTWFHLRIWSSFLTDAMATVGQRAHGDKSSQSCGQMASTAAKTLPDSSNWDTQKQTKDGKPRPTLLLLCDTRSSSDSPPLPSGDKLVISGSLSAPSSPTPPHHAPPTKLRDAD